MKKIRLLLLCALMTLSMCACQKDSTDIKETNQVTETKENELVPKDSEIYKEKDINQAKKVVKEYFKDFKGAEIVEIEYDGDDKVMFEKYAELYQKDEAIVLTSTIKTDNVIGDIPFDAGCTYENYKWVLARKTGEDWTVYQKGY